MEEKNGQYIHIQGASGSHKNTVRLQGVDLQEGQFAVLTLDEVREMAHCMDEFQMAARKILKWLDRATSRMDSQ